MNSAQSEYLSSACIGRESLSIKRALILPTYLVFFMRQEVESDLVYTIVITV